MRILFLSQLVPFPPDAGPKVRSYQVLKYLATKGHQITLLAFSRPDDQRESLAHLRQFCHVVHTVPMTRSRLRDVGHLLGAIVSGKPFLITRDSVKALHDTIAQLVISEEYDAIHADQLWMAQYALAAIDKVKRENRPKLVLDQHNAVHLVPQRLAASTQNPLYRSLLSLEARNMARYESEICRKFEHVVWVTDDDWQAVRRLEAGNPSQNRDRVIPICIDLEKKKIVPKKSKLFRVTFLGGLHWPPNAEGISWFYREVWPEIIRENPDLILTIIGKNPPAALKSGQMDDSNLEVTGYVVDPTEYLAETAVFIVPLLSGGGMRVKILDAWAWGLPIVSTTIGAEGLCYAGGDNLLLADRADEFARATLKVVSDPETSRSLRQMGRKTVEQHYNWRTVYPAWDQIYTT